MRSHRILTALILCLLMSAAAAAEETLLLRQPDIHGSQVAFVYAGDIWTAPSSGGDARKLTSHQGLELFPVFSPDGKWIAFSAEYSGNRQIWVMPSQGGAPRQLTFYPDVGVMPPRGGWDNTPVDWTADGLQILFRSNRTPYGKRVSRYFLVNADGTGMEQPLKIPEGGPASLSADGARLAYSIKSREYRTWKRYKAGRAQDLWIYDLSDDTIDRLTTYAGTDNFPMWVGNTIYFTSDRSTPDSEEPRTLNIFAFDLETRHIRQVTSFDTFDCLWPRRGGDRIVFENGGALWVLDTSDDTVKRLSISARDDRPHAQPKHINVSENISSYEISPSGKRAIFSARGDVFTVPAEHGRVRNITRTAGVREMDVGWSPDGKWLSYVAEHDGEYELFVRPYSEDGDAVQLTDGLGAWLTAHHWSPDSKKILLNDTRHRLHLIDVESRTMQEIVRGSHSSVNGVAWSADSRWIAYSTADSAFITSIWLYSVDTGSAEQLTGGLFSSYSPAFDPGGKYLYFVSSRDFNRSRRSFDAGLFLVTLQADLGSPFEAEEDDESIDSDHDDGASNGNGKTPEDEASGDADETAKKIEVDLQGIAERVIPFPLESGRLGQVSAVDGAVLYVRDNAIRRWSLEDREEKTVLEGARSFVLSGNGRKLLYSANGSWGIIKSEGESKPDDGKLDLDGMRMLVDPATEWPQIYTDAWRIMRDWFYDPGMHQVDWQAMHDKYMDLVDHVGHRADLDYVLGELVSELNVGHTYIQSPSGLSQMKRVEVGVLGCDLVADGDAFRIDRIFSGRPWNDDWTSPIKEPGVHINEGEYLLAVDGEALATGDNPYSFFVDRAGVPLTLTVNDQPTLDGAREVEITPAASELELRHFHWVERNRRLVEELSGGRVGYIFVPDTSTDGFREFYQGWQSQYAKDALIIDDRYNGGGQFPHPMVLHMARPVLGHWARRHLELASTPFATHTGPKVMLINGRSSSGGDAFPHYFREMKLGPLMGATTWGGLVGYGYSPSFVDGGGLAVPGFGFVNAEGEWDVEYFGVEPDIEVFDDPTLIQAGREPMIEEAVTYLLEQLAENPPVKVVEPAGPDRS